MIIAAYSLKTFL